MERKNAKESRRQHTIQFAELLAQEKGGWMCPVQACKSLLQMLSRKPSCSAPFCWREDGSLLTARKINKLLRSYLEGRGIFGQDK